MVIEKVQSFKHKCIIIADGKENIIAYEIAVRYKLCAGKTLTLDEFRTIIDESEQLLCKEYLYKMIGKYLKTEKGYRDKLYQLGYNKKAVENAIENAKNYGYINDENYCESYIYSYKNKKGINRIRQDLKIKGVSADIISKFLDTFESSEDIIDNLCNKFMKTREKNQDSRQKLYRHLIGKGFSYDEVSKAVNKCYNNAE